MGIFDRVGRVISSNFNALLDSAESPSGSIDATLTGMNEQIRAARQEVVRSVAAEKQLRNKVTELDEQIDTWARRAELAVKHDQDDLARDALRHKKRLSQERDRVEALRADQRGAALELKRELERMEEKVKELEAKKHQLAQRAEQAKAGESGASGPGGHAFAEFRRMEDQIEGVDAAFRAQREVDEALALDRGPGGLSDDEVEAKFRALERGQLVADADTGTSDIDDELSAIKRRVRIGK